MFGDNNWFINRYCPNVRTNGQTDRQTDGQTLLKIHHVVTRTEALTADPKIH